MSRQLAISTAGLIYLCSDGVDGLHRLGPEMAPAVLPRVVLLSEDRPDMAHEGGPAGEDPATAVRPSVGAERARAMANSPSGRLPRLSYCSAS